MIDDTICDDTICDVWWATLDAAKDWHLDLLDAVEWERVARLRRPPDRMRSALGMVLLRMIIGGRTGRSPSAVQIERTCRLCLGPHGRPHLPDLGWHVSVSHSGEYVAVAVTSAGPVGIDVERINDVDIPRLKALSLTPNEASAVASLDDFFCCWTRKEAVLKATGDGMGVPMTQVEVSRPGEAPALLRYPDRDASTVQMFDLRPHHEYPAAAAVLAHRPIEVRTHDGRPLLRGGADRAAAHTRLISSNQRAPRYTPSTIAAASAAPMSAPP